MMRKVFAVITFLSVFAFPWPLTAALALGVAVFEPLVPVITGVLIDSLYFVPRGHALPLFTLGGLLVTGVAFLVRSRLKTSIIGE